LHQADWSPGATQLLSTPSKALAFTGEQAEILWPTNPSPPQITGKAGPMIRDILKVWAFVLLLAAAAPAARGQASQEKTIATVKALGGQVTLDKGNPRAAVVAVGLGGCSVTDADLVHLGPLTGLQTLDL
jgi:hypothetical protein